MDALMEFEEAQGMLNKQEEQQLRKTQEAWRTSAKYHAEFLQEVHAKGAALHKSAMAKAKANAKAKAT
eukprot:7490045-Lingulodinium_polyedra.AAC.1